HQPREPVRGHRCAQVVALCARELEELGRHHCAHAVHAHVVAAALTATVAVEAGERFEAAGNQVAAEHVPGHAASCHSLARMRSAILVAATFLACAVEMVEALTIVLAAAFTRGWHSVRLGIAAALGALALAVALLGPALTLLPLEALRVVVGFLLLTLGLQWLRKALLRAAGYLPLHDEEQIFDREVREASASDGSADRRHFA